MKIFIPDYVKKILHLLTASGHSAYLVGGCVRDALLSRPINDYDITTSALPNEIKSALGGIKTVDTGIKHGTVGAVTSEGVVEITTFRIDGDYNDNRRPDSVVFTRSLVRDLSRRDFTVNALCYSESEGIIDLFGGINDIHNNLLRTVGDADRRFNEDALRILRAVRLCAQTGLTVCESTHGAMRRKKQLLKSISRERVKAELEKTILSPYCESAVNDFSDIILSAINCGKLTLCGENMTDLPKETDVRFANLLQCSAGGDILRSLKCEKKLCKSVDMLIGDMDFCPQNIAELRKFVLERGLSHTQKLCALKNNKAFSDMLSEIKRSTQCFSIKELKISGNDLIKMGYRGKQVGDMLKRLLYDVAEGKIKNEADELLSAAESCRPF